MKDSFSNSRFQASSKSGLKKNFSQTTSNFGTFPPQASIESPRKGNETKQDQVVLDELPSVTPTFQMEAFCTTKAHLHKTV